jgi:PhnB protein
MATQAQTQPAQTKTHVTQLVPYVFFYGRCEEALAFYEKALGGTYELMRNSDASTMSADCPPCAPEFKNKVMHATFTAPGITFMASDGREAKTIDPEEGNISLALSIATAADGERIFKALAEGGNIKMPLKEAFWGGKFGLIHDRFEVEWMVTTP